MAYTFDGATRKITLTTGTTTLPLRDMYSRWKDWVQTGDNSKWPPAFAEVVGGNPIDLAAGTYIPGYFYLINNWAIQPQMADHTLTVTGAIILRQGGGDPFADTPGYTVRVLYQQPVQAIAVGGGGGGLTTEQATQLLELYQRLGLQAGTPVVVTPNTLTAGTIQQTITEAGTTRTVARVP